MLDTEHLLAAARTRFPNLIPQLTGPWPGECPWHCNFLDRVLHSEILDSPAKGPTIEDAVRNAEEAMSTSIADIARRRHQDKMQAGDTL